MNKETIKLILALIALNLLLGCQSLKEGLEGSKKSKSAEEFLIQKKNPLVLPPDFSKLPTPKNSTENETDQGNLKIEDILKKNSKKEVKNSSKKKSSLEESILEKIKKN